MRFRRDDGRRSPAAAVQQLRAASAPHLRARAAKARRSILLMAPAVAAVVLANRYRMQLFGVDEPVRIACAFALVGLGLGFARDSARAVGPALEKRLDLGTAGTIGFLLRFALLVAAVVIGLRIAGLTPHELAVGGAVTAIVLGLAAQQTIGNLFAGLLLLSVRPFRLGDRVRLQAGALAGIVEGTVTQFGLLYVTFRNGEDTILVPNIAIIGGAIVPLREPGGVDLRARLRPDVKPSELQQLIENAVTTPTRDHPHITLEEVDDDEVVMRVTATPASDEDGPKLADEVLSAVNEAAR
jgi:small conductance mechanosensitive channel